MVVVDRMKIGFMMAEDEAKEFDGEVVLPSISIVPPGTITTRTYEEEDENGIIILSTLTGPNLPPSPPPLTKSNQQLSSSSSSISTFNEHTIKIPNINTITSSISTQNYSYNGNGNIQASPGFKPSRSPTGNPAEIGPPASFQMSPGKSTAAAIQQQRDDHYNNGTINIPNFASFITTSNPPHRSQIDLTHSPKQDSVRTTPSTSVGTSPFMTPRGSSDGFTIHPYHASIASEDTNTNNNCCSEGSPHSPCGSDEDMMCETNPDGSPAFGPRSMACDKHSKWKKRCPDTCVGRISPIEFPTTTRKLWSQDECCRLLEMVFQKDPQSVTSKESEMRWRSIASTLGRTVTSTRKKYMRLMNKWSPRPSMTTSVHPISKLIESNERKRKGVDSSYNPNSNQTTYPQPIQAVKDQKLSHDSHPTHHNNNNNNVQSSNQYYTTYNNNNNNNQHNNSSSTPSHSFTSYHAPHRLVESNNLNSLNNNNPNSNPYFVNNNNFAPIKPYSSQLPNQQQQQQSHSSTSPSSTTSPRSPSYSGSMNGTNNNTYIIKTLSSASVVSSSSAPTTPSMQGSSSPHHHLSHHLSLSYPEHQHQQPFTSNDQLNNHYHHQFVQIPFQSQNSKFKKPIGRPPEACMQHRTEHQKCPKGCPHRPDASSSTDATTIITSPPSIKIQHPTPTNVIN